MTRVTIGIPFFNNETTLADAIKSVFAQTFEDWELILVDDGSCDRSLEIARSIKDSRVKVISDGKNLGLSARLNQIADSSCSDYLARMDADDIMHPERIEQQIKYLDSNADIDVVGSSAYIIDNNNNITGIRSVFPLDLSPNTAAAGSIFIHPSVTGRTEWFNKNRYDEDFLGAEDYELWCRTLKISRFGKIVKPLIFYRENRRSQINYLKHYLKATHYYRMALQKHGYSLVGYWKTKALIMKSHIKSVVYTLATLSGMQYALVEKRNCKVFEEEIIEAAMLLENVLSTNVPGLTYAEQSLKEAA